MEVLEAERTVEIAGEEEIVEALMGGEDGACGTSECEPAGLPGDEEHGEARDGEAGLRDEDGTPPDGESEPGGGARADIADEFGWELRGEIDPDRPRSRDISTADLGKRGEDAATAYLVRKGYRILERNWMCRFGEADIIAVDEEGTICFIEVKTRRTVDCGLPEEAVTPEKQRRYEKIALSYLMEADWDDCVALRFDAIGICVTGDFKAVLKHHLACFNGL